MDTRTALGNTPFFAQALDAEALDTLAQAAERVEFDHGATVIRENDHGDSMFVIVDGACAISVRTGGADKRVATLREGDIVGEMSLLTGARRSATVTALRPTTAVEIKKDALQPILERSPELAYYFAGTVEKRKSELEELYGPLQWLKLGDHASDFADAIRRFFGQKS